MITYGSVAKEKIHPLQGSSYCRVYFNTKVSCTMGEGKGVGL